MEKIASFTIDHIRLQPGLYVSRKDRVGENVVTTFDLRMTSPNEEPVMNTAEMHTIEHLGATFLRNRDDFGDKTLYFGPMGGRPGFICYWPGTMIPGGAASCDGNVPVYPGFPGARCRERRLRTAATIWT